MTNGTTYYFKVRGVNQAGLGPESVAVSTVPEAVGITEVITDIQYYASGQKKSVFFGNGNRTDYTYDANLRLKTVKTSQADNTVIQDLTYTYDGVGNILNITDNTNTSGQGLGYDEQGRLTFAQGIYVSGQPAVSKQYSCQ